jgi:YidC/Oxa1 family membrane protein insertase
MSELLMISAAFHAAVYAPLYNGLVFLVDVLPTHDVGVAVILLTILVRFILYPLSTRAVQAQMAMKQLAPDVEALKKKHKDNREEQSRAIFALYKERGIHPFAGFVLVLLQFPVLIGLYFVFARGGLPQVDVTALYSFVDVPAQVNMHFLGIINMGERSLFLAALATATQFAYTRLSMGPPATKDPSPVESSLSGDLAKSFDLQARYVLPLMVGAIAFSIVAAAPLYWSASNLFMLVQEYASGKRFYPKNDAPTPRS